MAATTNRFIELPLGPAGVNCKTIQVDRERYSIDRSDRLTFAVMKIRQEFSPEAEHPRLMITETDETTGNQIEREEDDIEYGIRVMPLLTKKYERAKDESDDDFLKRIHVLRMSTGLAKISFRIVEQICKIFELPELTEEEFRQATLNNVQSFLKEVLEAGQIRFQGKLWPIEQ